MNTKKQDNMIKEAIRLINNAECDGQEWDNLFEDSQNNTNAVILGIIKQIEKDKQFALQVERLEDYMPESVLKYAKYKNLISGVSAPDFSSLEDFLNKIQDYNRFYEVPPDRNAWEHLNRYYIKPLYDLLDELNTFNFEED